MPRPTSPETRRALIEHAAARLARREPVTLRSLAAAVGVSTMAVYTYFDGMPGLWAAVRQEAFERLRFRLQEVRPVPDPVQHLATLGVAYVESALASPALYRAMFDGTVPLADPRTAAAGFTPIVDGVRAAQEDGRFARGVAPSDVATRFWAAGHGLASLAVGGVLPVADVTRHGPALAVAVFLAAGDDRDEAERSVAAAWRGATLPPSSPAP